MSITKQSTKKWPVLNWIASKKLHLIIWVIFIFYEAIIVGLINGKFGRLTPYVLYYALNITTFYVHAHLILSVSLRNPRQTAWKLPLLLFAEIAAYFCISICLDYIIINYTAYTGSRKITLDLIYFSAPLYRCVYFMCFSTGYYFLIRYIKERKKTEELEKQRLNNLIQLAKSENAFLKAQIQPHLLFNTLDFIYQHARESSPIAAETILSLSEMMRYSVDNNKDKDFVLLAEEINQVENLINLHQLRQNHGISLRFWYDDEIRRIKIIPMVLITLAENMFKHGELLKPAYPAEISIKAEQGKLIIETANLIKEVKDHSGLQAGLENIKKRLAYAYGRDATFDYTADADNYFRVILSVTIKKDNQL
ncbi:sensor histidine kinase [Pedobacter soli]|uniref:Histidine kinase n=1 Tax=Pedobacter soli TaxID=390242 RepID=A0A1G6SJH6_9SPHI|nr:sensor histidine kinase [Pedobacter soli]SDD17062.1 Histidine kinase [Pedobacter soli]